MAEQAVPRNAAELLELAKAHGWKTMTAHGEDSGGAPYVTVHIGRRCCDRTSCTGSWYYRITWHTRDTGTYRLFSSLAKTPTHRGWHDGPSLKAIREVIQENPAC